MAKSVLQEQLLSRDSTREEILLFFMRQRLDDLTYDEEFPTAKWWLSICEDVTRKDNMEQALLDLFATLIPGGVTPHDFFIEAVGSGDYDADDPDEVREWRAYHVASVLELLTAWKGPRA